MQYHESKLERRSPRKAVALGIGVGLIFEIVALLIAFVSAGVGHGDYVLARVLFPFSLEMTLLEGSIGLASVTVGLLQFPLIGAITGWAWVRRSYVLISITAAAYLAATAICFSGALEASGFL